MIRTGIIAAFVVGGVLCKANVITLAECSVSVPLAHPPSFEQTVNSSGPSSATSSCSMESPVWDGWPGGGDGRASATVEGSISPTAVSMSAHADAEGFQNATAYAHVDGYSSLTLSTPGPIRWGLMTFSRSGSLWGRGQPWGVITVGPYQEDCGVYGALTLCSGLLAEHAPTLPFPLGVPFVFSGRFIANAYGSHYYSDSSGGQLGLTYSLSEVDGTAVEVMIVPEPATFTLASVAAVLIALSRKIARRRPA